MYNKDMEPKNIFYISATVSVLIFAIASAYAFFRLAQVFKALKLLVEDLEDTTHDVRALKDKLKSNSLSLVALLLKGLVKKSVSKRVVK